MAKNLNKPLHPALNIAGVSGCFRKRTFIEVFCKKCGVRYSDDGEYEKVFQDKAEAIETITEEENWLVKGQDAFCENCH